MLVRSGATLKLSRLHVVKFIVAGRAEAAQQINTAIDSHFPQFEKAFLWLQIGIQNFACDCLSVVNYLRRRQNPHPAQLRIKTDQTGNVRFIVLERINVALGGFLDEIPVEDLPAALLVKQPLGADLTSVVEPVRYSARQAADSCSGQGRAEMVEESTGAVPTLLEVMTTGPC